MNAILQFVLKYVLEFAFGKLQNWISKKKKIDKHKAETKKQVAKLKAAIDKAYDGEEVSKEQSKEIVDAAKALMSDY